MKHEALDIFLKCIKFFELIAAIVGFLHWNKIKNTHWRWFPVYLIIIFIGETIAFFLTKQKMIEEKYLLYTWFIIPLEFLFFYWLFFKEKLLNEKLILSFSVLYVVAVIADNLFFSNKKFFFSSFSYMIGNFFLLLILLMFILKFSKTEKIVKFNTEPIFWVCMGLVLFYLGTFPYFGLRNKLFYYHNSIFINYTWAMGILNYIMYSLFALSFIWGKPK